MTAVAAVLPERATEMARAQARRGVAMLGVSMVSVQSGAALASSLFDRLPPPSVVLLRQGIGAILLLALARPRIRGRQRRDWAVVVAFGVVLAAMNTSMYGAVERLPLGLAVTIELLGPLGLALAMSRGGRELAWVSLAVVGVVALGRSTGRVDPVGVVLALIAAGGWASYIVLSARTGRHFERIDGLALAMAVATITVAPFGVASGGGHLLVPSSLVLGLGVALLSAAIPFTLEITALRTIPARTFSVMMSLSPAVAALVGRVTLSQPLGILDVAAIICVVVASAATLRASARRRQG